MRRVLLVRHAECQMNLDLASRVGGRSNESPLTPKGVRQAEALGRHLATSVAKHAELGPCFTSTAVRAVDTLTIALAAARQAGHAYLCSPQGLALRPVASEQLLELEQGAWEGQLRAECYTPEVVERIARDPHNFAAPGGESQRQVEERVTAFVREQVLPALRPGGPPALVVSHGLAIKCFLRGILDSAPAFSRRIHAHNTSVTEVVWLEREQTWELARVNDCTHLALDEELTGKMPAAAG